MSVLNGDVTMELDSTDCEEPSTPLKDPTSSPAVHIQWQNSQSACAAMEELRVASSVPRRPPKPLTFDFELPASAGPSSRASDPFFSSRTRLRSARSRNIERVQKSNSQSDVFATPAADASKFLDMLGRASARVDENSRKRMKVLGERAHARGPKGSLIKGNERLCAKTRGTRSMDELGDNTNFIRDAPESETRVHYSSLPIMLESQSTKDTAKYKNDVHADSGTGTVTTATAASPAPGSDGMKLPVSTRPHATLSTRHSQKRIEPPSPTPVRSSASTSIPFRPVPAPAPAHRNRPNSNHIHSQQPHPVPTPLPPPAAVNDVVKGAPTAAAAASGVPMPMMSDSIPRHGRSTSSSTSTIATTATASASATSASTSLISAHLPQPPSSSQTYGSKRALGMTRSVTVPRSFSSSSSKSNNNTPHSAATKKPFRPPLARPAAKSQIPPTPNTSSHSHDSQRQRPRRQEDGGGKKGSGADPDSSFDISFDFDPDALEAAMKQYD